MNIPQFNDFMNELKATISSGKMYSVKATYAGPSGTIDTITIEEVNAILNLVSL